MFELRQKRRRFRAAVFEHPAHKASFVIGKRPIVIAHRKPSRVTGAQGVGNTILLVFYWAPRCDTGRVFAILGARVPLATRKHKSLRVQGVGNTVLLVFYWAPRNDTGRIFAILGAWGVSISSNVFLAGTRGLTGFCLAIG